MLRLFVRICSVINRKQVLVTLIGISGYVGVHKYCFKWKWKLCIQICIQIGTIIHSVLSQRNVGLYVWAYIESYSARRIYYSVGPFWCLHRTNEVAYIYIYIYIYICMYMHRSYCPPIWLQFIFIYLIFTSQIMLYFLQSSVVLLLHRCSLHPLNA